MNSFEAIYARAKGDPTGISWADLVPNPNLVRWLEAIDSKGAGKRAVVVGCGLGDDAEELVRRGFMTNAFDVSPTAIQWCRSRFPNSSVEYVVADLFQIASEWQDAFDIVLESYTLQVLPAQLRQQAISSVAALVAPGGTLLLIARGRDGVDPPGNSPWPLTREELGEFVLHGLEEQAFQDFMDEETPPVRRFVITYRRR